MFWETWAFVFSVTMPSLVLLLLGIVLRRIRLIDDNFCHTASRLVFTLAIPVLLFFSIATNPVDLKSNLPLALFGAVGTVLSFFLLELVAPKLVKEPADRGVFVQGGFRANTATLGLAYCASAYGNEGVAVGSLYMAATVILFNALSVVTLMRHAKQAPGVSVKSSSILKGIVSNPIIIAIVLGLIFSFIQLPIPALVMQTSGLVSGLALPLALICAGASLDWRAMSQSSQVAGLSALAKLVVIPVLMTIGGALLGFEGVALGVMFLFTASPTAAVSYVMTKAIGGNSALSANIVAITTLGSFFTTSVGLYVLRTLGMV